jgi:drug/metabolite transporter (DMT)-like permease
VPSIFSVAAMAVVSLVWGYSWILNKIAITAIGPFAFSAYRMVLASACLLATMALTGRSLKPTRWPEMLRLGLIQTSCFIGLSMWALVEGSVGRTSILVFTMPFWTVALAWPLLGEPIRRWQWLAMGLALAGLVLLIRPWDPQGSLFSKLLAAASGLAWAAGSVEVKRMQRKAPLDLLGLTTWQMVFGAVPLIGVGVFSGEPTPVWTLDLVLILLMLSCVATALCWVLWLYVLRKLSTTIASMSTLAVPVIAILSAHWQLGERAAPTELAGMLCIGVALVVLILSGQRSLRGR